MDKDTRNAIERATQRGRRLLEEDFGQQLEGVFDVLRSGGIAAKGGPHLNRRQMFQREKIVAAIEHKRGAGMSPADAVGDYLRDAAFTTLNRFVALKMLEARELVQECITKGEQSAGYREFCGLAPGAALIPESAGYRVYVECLFDELSTEVKVLFDRRDPSSVLWPKRPTFNALLEELNDASLASVWGEDETIGWVYQFFNGGDERRAMREASQAPRNSRELAVRNQFFTPRYVVQFLTDNTLGRIWWEMRGGQTALTERCQYMVRRPQEILVSDIVRPDERKGWIGEVLDGDFRAIPEDFGWNGSAAFAHLINGYALGPALGLGEAGKLANERSQEAERTGTWEGTAAELWICLFFEHRRYRHFGFDPEGEALTRLDALCQTLRAKLVADQEQPPSTGALTLVPHRAKKDPRDLRVLDPACGSGHFLLYAFDLLVTIYEESWDDLHISNPPSEITGRTLHEDYPDKEALRRALPGLLLAHNLHGVDIDPRCAQIAQLALWMRAQRAFKDFEVGRAERPPIRRSNIVIAEPLVTDDATTKAFLKSLRDEELARVFTDLVETLKLAGDLGLLLRVEALVPRGPEKGRNLVMFAPAEERIRSALAAFVSASSAVATTRRRLFVDDAAQGVGLLETAEKKFEVVLMNPPFGQFTSRSLETAKQLYPDSSNDIYACFVLRALELAAREAFIGVLSSRLGFFLEGLEDWRGRLLAHEGGLSLLVDLGYGVLDDALVETAAYVVDHRTSSHDLLAMRLLGERDKTSRLRDLIGALTSGSSQPASIFLRRRRELANTPGKIVAYWLPRELLQLLSQRQDLGRENIVAYSGLQTDDDYRFLRLWWEVSGDNKSWIAFAKGGEYLPFADDLHLVTNWRDDGREMKAFVESKYRQWSRHIKNTDRFLKSGLTYTERTTSDISVRPLPRGAIFSVSGPCIQGPDLDSLELAWAALSSRPGRALVDTLVGSGDTSKAGTAARHYRTRLIAAFPSVRASLGTDERRMIREAVHELYRANMAVRVRSEVHRLFMGVVVPGSSPTSLAGWCKSIAEIDAKLFEASASASAVIDELVAKAFGLQDVLALEQFSGPHPMFGHQRPHDESAVESAITVLTTLISGSDEETTRIALQAGLSGRVATKQCYFFSRELELACLVANVRPETLVEATTRAPESAFAVKVRALADDILSLAFGSAIGRWSECLIGADRATQMVKRLDPFEELPAHPPASQTAPNRSVLVDDLGHASDIGDLVTEALARMPLSPPDVVELVARVMGGSLREYYAQEFFPRHVAAYSNSRRRAPIYWQLATPSASYSVWLYLHAFTRNTLHDVQNDFVVRKVAHEEHKLKDLREQFGDSPNAANRKTLTAQETLVDELRGFLDEVKRVAPLWNPDLDDGVVINFAPLWRLVPHHKPWQKELKATWDSLCAGEYDWAHLAMHLWPERVVPKCATDRSLAIAHDLEKVFWVEGPADKWKPRTTPTTPVEELVAGRTSAAVKAALKSLMEAPTAGGSAGPARGKRSPKKKAGAS